jgi:membrane associated rhomboid family serine protease
MNSVSRQWLVAPSILGALWTQIFTSVDYNTAAQTWWQTFVLQPGSSVLSVVTTTFYHANLPHLLSNLVFVYTLAFVLRGVLSPAPFMALWLIFAPLATLISYLSDPNPLVGASGGLMAILGGALSVAVSSETNIQKKWLSLALVATLVFLAPGDRTAHMSGLCLGYCLGGWIINARYALNIGLGFTLSCVVYLIVRT